MHACMHARIDGLLSSPWSYIDEIGLGFVQFILLMLTKILQSFVCACSSGQQLLTSRVTFGKSLLGDLNYFYIPSVFG
jgi:hypothetical protein